MIVLYRRPDDPWADEVQEALDEMVIAYETETIPGADAPPSDVPDTPALRDDGEVVAGEAALREHLDELRQLMADWDRFQSDACYVEDDGAIC
jgi:glutathione S-transferase